MADEKDLKYNINVDAETKGADRAHDALEEVQKLAERGIKDLEVKGDTKGVERLKRIIEEAKAEAAKATPLKIDSTQATGAAKSATNAIREANDAAEVPSSLRVDSTAAVDAAKRLKAEVESVKAASDKKSAKTGFFGQLKNNLDELRQQVPIVDKVFGALELLAKGPLAAVIIGFTTLAGAVKVATVSFGKFIAESRGIAKLDAALARNGQLTDENRKKYLAVATELQNFTGTIRTEWLPILQKLVTFGSKPENVGIDVQTVINLAGALGGSEGLAQATDLYARALKGEFGAFQELGFGIDASLSQHEKMAKLQKEAAIGAGVLAAEAADEAGEVKKLSNDLATLAISLGRGVAQTGVFQTGIGLARDGIGFLNSLLPQTIERIDGLTNKLPDLSDELKIAAENAEELGDAAFQKVVEGATAAEAALANYLARLRELEQAELLKTDATAARDLAQVDLDEARGDISESDAKERRFEIRDAAADRKLEIETKALELQGEELLRTIEENEAKVQEKLEEANRLSKLIAEKSDELAPQDQRLDAIRAELAALAKERADLDKRIPELERNDRVGKGLLGGPANVLLGEVPGLLDLQAKLAKAAGANIDADGILANRDELESSRARREEIESRSRNLGNEGSEIEASVAAPTEEIQNLNAELEALQKAYSEQRRLADEANERLRLQAQSNRLALDTKRAVGSLQNETREIGRETDVVSERRSAPEDGLQEPSRQVGNRLQGFAEGFQPQAGSTRQTAFAEALKTEAAKFDDGADVREIEAVKTAIRSLFGAIDDKQSKQATELRGLAREVARLEGIVRNNR